MNKKSRNTLWIALMALLITGLQCQKFEDDPEWIHLKSVKKRVVGYKELEQDMAGSFDMMDNWKRSFGDFYLHFTSEAYRPDTTGFGYRMFLRKKGTNDNICSGEWGFKGSETIYWRLDCFDQRKSRFFPNRMYSWEAQISRLSDKEMWVAGSDLDSTKTPVKRNIRFKEYKY